MRFPMNKATLFALALLVLVPMQTRAADITPVWNADLNAIRHVAAMLPGARATSINVVKFAESRRTKNFAIKGAPKEPSVQARTAYQLVYPDGTVMIDSGMDQQVHRFFGRGVEEPYFPDSENEVERALRGARTIVMTHEHGDHVAGVIRTPRFAELAAKTVLTRTQVNTLVNDPQMSEIKLTPEMASHFIVIDYDKYYPFAPGVALIKAPGHTPGSQLIYVALQSGKEYLFAGDVAWHMDGVREVKGKDAPWITEPEDVMMAELTWLNGLMKSERNLTIVISHDDEQRQAYIQQGLLGGKMR
jgi:glyoxylase-like metal-dependent hydrolase (beta-lactamase superfamily II)